MARSAIFDHNVYHHKLTSRLNFHTIGYHKHFQYVFNHKLTSQIELSTLWPFWYFLTFLLWWQLYLFVIFHFFTQKRGPKTGPRKSLHHSKNSLYGGYPKKPWTHFVIFNESVRVWAVLRKNQCFSGERTDIGSAKLADVIGASRNKKLPLNFRSNFSVEIFCR